LAAEGAVIASGNQVIGAGQARVKTPWRFSGVVNQYTAFKTSPQVRVVVWLNTTIGTKK